MENKKLIYVDDLLLEIRNDVEIDGKNFAMMKMHINEATIVDVYTKEQVASIIQRAEEAEAKNKELEKEVTWLKSCLNCKIHKECPRHCGKVVHNCDHWEHGDSTIDAVEVVHGRWERMGEADYKCSVCGFRFTSSDPISMFSHCRCGAKMDGDT